MRIIVASQNPIKIAAARQGFQQMFPTQKWAVEGISVPSGVSDQPRSHTETWEGAFNRARAARTARPDGDYWVGIEGGIAEKGESMEAFAWMVIMDKERRGEARTCTFSLPKKVAELVKSGMELGEADDIVFGAENSKQKNGAVGLLTGNVMVRESLYIPAIILALIPFRNRELYS
ncbi:MAG: inosine/xanthosine triphosphatase [Bacteroidota bacterium]